MENKVIDNKTRRYCLYIGLLACLVAVTVMVGHAAAYQFTFDPDGDDLDFWDGNIVATIYSDNYVNVCGNFLWQDVAYPSNYWAFTVLNSGPNQGQLNFKDINNVKIYPTYGVAWKTTWETYDRVEYTRVGSTVYEYKNGVLQGSHNIGSTIPYYIYTYCLSSKYDNVVIGTNEEHDVVSGPPSTWWVAKDIFDPGFSGLYSDYDTQVYVDTMHISYANDDGSMTITVTHSGGTVVNTTVVSDYAGIIEYNLTEMLFESGAPYGHYIVASSGTDAFDTFTYQGITTTGTNCNWDDTEYVDGDTATIGYNIGETYWMTDDYTYELRIEDTDFDEMDSWSIITRPVGAEREVTVSTSLFPTSGYYYCGLYAIDKSSGEEILMCYDYAYMYLAGSGEVIVEGETYDATTGNLLGECVVTATQGGTPHTDTSDATDATYQITGLVTDSSIGVNATKTSYIGYPIYFTPYEGGHYEVDVPLVPSGGASPGEWQEVTGGQLTQINHNNTTTTYYNLTEDGTAIGGLVYEAPYWNMCDGATVTLSNATWNTNTTTGDGGWYQINNISAGGNYNFCCEKDGFSTVNETITVTAASFNRQDCYLNGDFTLTINIKNLDTSTTITDEVSVSLDSGETTTTSTGTCTFEDLDYGYYTITGECVGYYAGTAYAVVDGDVTENLYLQAESEGGSGFGVGYAPKTVRFTTQTMWGSPIQDCCVNCTGYETTVGSWEWLYTLFGVDVNETPVATAEMGGYTDYKGDINFVMFEPVKYECSFVKAGEINKTIEIYPKDDYYLILATDYGNASWLEGGVDINKAVTIAVTTETINTTAAYVIVNYTDTSSGTTGGTVYLNQTDPDDPAGPELNIDSYTITGSSFDTAFTVTDYSGESFFVRVRPVHSTWDFERDFAVTFPEEQFNPMGLTDTELAMIATFLILFAGCLFGAVSAPHAPLVMSFLGWLFLAFGWLDAVFATASISLVLATVMSIVYLIMIRSKKERWV